MDEKLLQIFQKNKEVAFATAVDGVPHVRIFQIMKIDAATNSIYFATSPKKQVYMQLNENPQVAILDLKGAEFGRINGTIDFNIPDGIQREIFESNPVLPHLYKSYKDLVYLRLPAQTADYFDLRTNPPTLVHYDF